MSKEHKKTENTEVAVQTDAGQKALAMRAQVSAMAAEMQDLGISAEDIVVPLLMLAQNTSGMVGDGKAKLGDIVHSLDETVLGGIDKSVDIIPLRLLKTVRIYDVSGGSPKFIRAEPDTGVRIETEGREGDIPIKRYRTMNFYVLLKTDIDKDEAFPCMLRLKSTGAQAGRQIASHMFKMLALGRVPYSSTIKLTVTKQKKDTNTYAVFGVSQGVKCDAKALAEAEKWLPRLAALQVDERRESDDESESAGPTVVPSVVQPKSSEKGPY